MLLLTYDTKPKYKYAYKDASFEGFDQSVCPACGRMVSSLRFASETHQLILEGGKCCPDLLAFTGAGERLFFLSETALTLFRQNGISGFDRVSAVTVCDETMQTLPDAPKYFCVEITGKIDLDISAMCLKKKRCCARCGQFDWNRQRIEPIRLDESTWDGSDVCRVSSIPGYIVCSQKLADVVTQNRLTGFTFSQM